MSTRPILLAEDDEKLLRLYSDLLESDGFTVLQASNGAEAIALLHKVPQPLLIILDVVMPRMDGIEACILIRKMQTNRPSPILFLSHMETPAGILDCLRAGGDDYLVKSGSLQELRARARYWSRRPSCEEREARRQRSIRALEAMVEGEEPAAESAEEPLDPLPPIALDRAN